LERFKSLTNDKRTCYELTYLAVFHRPVLSVHFYQVTITTPNGRADTPLNLNRIPGNFYYFVELKNFTVFLYNISSCESSFFRADTVIGFLIRVILSIEGYYFITDINLLY